MAAELPVVGQDRSCRAGTLDNPLRRWLAPAARDLDLLDLRPGQKVADLGSGVGFFLPEIARRTGSMGALYAVDPDAGNLATARQRPVGATPITFLERSASSVPEIPDGGVDRVLLSLVLCCLVDKAGVLDTAWRILRPGGRALVSYPKVWGPAPPRRRPLRVTAPTWERLMRLHPWAQPPVRSGWIVTRHLLERPAASHP